VQDHSSKRSTLDPNTEDKIDLAALRRSAGDIALWFHHRAVLVGEWRILQRGNADWNTYVRTRKLEQFISVEQSVIRGWRKYIQTTLGLPPAKQQDNYAVNCELVLDWVRRKRGTDELQNVFKKRPATFSAAAERGDVGFFQSLGRLLSGKQPSKFVKTFEYAPGTLSRWITEYYWLMPSKLVSQLVAMGLNISDKEKTFLSFKSRYGLKSHNPPLIDRLEKDKNNQLLDVFTKKGLLLLGKPPGTA
jgi:hypothetical protein